MKMSVIGSGYVGLVAGACFADSGNHVICVDKDAEKIRRLARGEVPIYEPGLAEIVLRNTRAMRLEFTTNTAEAVRRSRIIFIAVGTPPGADGGADLSGILEVAETIGKHMDGYRIVVVKSTVPVGTHKKVSEVIAAQTDHPFDYVSNPEFLKEGAAIEDFTKPDRVVIGTTNPAVVEVMRELYGPFMRKSERILAMDPASAEMTKYAANALLATKISFMNEIAGLCERFGADVEMVRRGVGSDSRIGTAFLFPGVGYGGSCFPKDVSALTRMGEEAGHPMRIVQAVQAVNQQQRRRFAQRVIEHFGEACPRTTLAVWGLAFKARTDDVRESPAISAVRMFLEKGIKVRAHDPEAMETAAAELGPAVTMVDDEYAALDGADALVIFTDWDKFRTPDFELIAEKLHQRLIFDGRNMYDPKLLARRGFRYVCVGRPTYEPEAG
ncbi:MAG: UDP-glucose/GDP-mannose dehydrogenase family protein [Planctomycetota bacterium]|nr:MAG: UDP-glucose/GDP-mannose dehydrogenase family protein [Planctomycetota bacterium]